MREFWSDYVKPKYYQKVKLCYMDTNNFLILIKKNDIYKDIEEYVEIRFDTSKVIGLMKDELGGKIMKEFVGLTAKTHSYLIDNGGEDEKAKDTKKWVIKRKLKFENYENCF